VFTGDGQHILFERTPPGAEPRVHVVELDGGPARPLVDAPGNQPAASPVDDRIVFVGPDDAAGKRRVWLTDLAGGAPRQVPNLPPAAWQRPRFSADGKRLLLLRASQEVVEARVDGSAPPAVLWRSGTEGVQAADYAPDGDGIIAALADYDGDLWLAEGRFP
jgi:Tol biopolymer transport system component